MPFPWPYFALRRPEASEACFVGRGVEVGVLAEVVDLDSVGSLEIGFEGLV